LMALKTRSALGSILPWAATGTVLIVALLATSKGARERMAAFLWLHGGQQGCERLLRPRKEAFIGSVELAGTVLDVGTGAGVRLKYLALRPGVTRILCVEPNVNFRAALKREIDAVQKRRVETFPEAPLLVIDVAWETIEEFLATAAAAADDANAGDSGALEFDAATCFLVLCTIPDPGATVAAIHDRCLKPG
jgi:SAM-dependent methyltransferase